jgi:carbon monoxide dehydrogenase subunit G
MAESRNAFRANGITAPSPCRERHEGSPCRSAPGEVLETIGVPLSDVERPMMLLGNSNWGPDCGPADCRKDACEQGRIVALTPRGERRDPGEGQRETPLRFEKEIVVPVPPERVWAFLWDVEGVARCLPGCRDVRMIAPQERYEAVVSERVGPFKVQFPLEIRILEVEPLRRFKAVASGRDVSVGSSLKVTLDLRLSGTEDRSRLIIVSEVSILGKLGTLGHGIIQHKADDLMTRFAQNLEKALDVGVEGK